MARLLNMRQAKNSRRFRCSARFTVYRSSRASARKSVVHPMNYVFAAKLSTGVFLRLGDRQMSIYQRSFR
jgi:hypothetical protein